MRAMMTALVLVALTAGAATAEEWRYDGGSVPIAYFDNGAAQLQFACRGGDLALGFWVRKPSKTVATASVMNLAITPDAGDVAAARVPAGSSFAQEIPLIHADGSSMIVRGPVAKQWARIAQQAKSTLRVGYVRAAAKGGFEMFDANVFGARGSSATIKRVLDRCG
jgi:hypothetical protein